MIGEFENSAEQFTSFIDTLKVSLEISSVIYSKIQDYRDHMAFVNFIVKIQSETANASINFGQHQNDVNSIQSSIQYNVVNEMYTKSLASIEQWMFPFAYHILEDCKPLNGSQDNKIAIMKENLVNIKRRLDTYF